MSARQRIAAMVMLVAVAYGAGAAVGAVTPEVHDQPAPTDHGDHGNG